MRRASSRAKTLTVKSVDPQGGATVTHGDLGRVPILIQDRAYMIAGSTADMPVRPVSYVEVLDGPLLDGPASDRVAVVDIDNGDHPARSLARVLPPTGARRIRNFEFDEQLLDPDNCYRTRLDFEDEMFVRLHVFGCVHTTLKFFEELLGRRIRWACATEQLTLMPWAGDGLDAFYDRESGSIQFLTHTTTEGRNILFALSRDIVSHEAGHAILDAVAPDLYDATDPDSRTIHEAVGDLAAVLQTLLDDAMVFSAEATFGAVDVDALDRLGRIAEEVGEYLGRRQGASALRSASSAASFSVASPGHSLVDRSDPHEATTVIVGALFETLRDRINSGSWSFERGIPVAARELSRIVIPALHRLPAGEASLSDFARALDSAALETSSGRWWMKAIVQQLVERGVADDAASFSAPTPEPEPLVGWPGTDATELVEANRERLAVPPDASPIAAVVEFHDRAWTKNPRRRVQLRVSWDVEEKHDLGGGVSVPWPFRVGTTAVLEAETGVPVSILSSDTSGEARERRGEQLGQWGHAGLIGTAPGTTGVLTEIDDRGRQRLVGTARTLHLIARS